MVELSGKIKILSTLKPGVVYKFVSEETKTPYPHYHIVINSNTQKDQYLLLTIISSKIEKVQKRRENLPNTTVMLLSEENEFLRVNSIVDCNTVITRSKADIIDKIENNKLALAGEIHLTKVEEIRKAVLISPLIENEIKKMLE